MKKLLLKLNAFEITSWITIQSFILIGAAIFSLVVVNLGSTFIFGIHNDITIGYFLGLIIPFSIILGFLNNFTIKSVYKYFTVLTDAIKKVADGEFDTKIDIDSKGPFTSVYENFNKMSSELDAIHIFRNDFINNYAHEFKTPIVSIKGFADLLLNTEVTDEQRVQYLTIISEESDRLAHLANSSILLSKLDSQIIVDNKSVYSLDEQLRKCIIMLSNQWNSKNISINSDLDMCNYYGNEQLMQHLWINLLSNAIRYTPDNGCIKISLFNDKNKFIIEIQDNGIGMDQETIKHIFDKYYQANTNQSRNGLGLGLSIVKRIIDLTNSNITVSSNINVGTTFKVVLTNPKH